MRIPSADHITVHVCEHGTAYLRLHDESGAIFAVAAMQPEVAVALIDRITEELQAWVDASRAAPQEGHA